MRRRSIPAWSGPIPRPTLGGEVPRGSIAVSAKTGEGIKLLLERIGKEAAALLPGEGAIALNRRQASHIEEAGRAISEAADRAMPCWRLKICASLERRSTS